MEDNRLKERINNFKNSNLVINEEIITNKKLKMRKEKLDKLLIMRRKINSEENCTLQIDQSTLDLPYDVDKIMPKSQIEYFDILEKLLNSQNINEVKLGINHSRRLLSSKKSSELDPNEFIRINYLKIILEIVSKSSDLSIIYEGIWCLLNISCEYDDEELLNAFLDKKFIELILKNLESNIIPILENCLILLGNLAHKNVIFRDLITINFLKKIIEISNDASKVMIEIERQITYIINGIVSGYPEPNLEITIICLELSLKYFFHSDVQILRDSIWAISIISESDYREISERILKSDICRLIINNATSLKELKLPSIRILGNMIIKNDGYTESMLEIGVLNFLHYCLLDNHFLIRKETLWIISNLCAGTDDQVILILKNDKIMEKLKVSIKDPNKDIRAEAFICLTNSCYSNNIERLSLIFNHRFIELFVDGLRANSDSTIIKPILEGTIMLFENGKFFNNVFIKLFEQMGGQQIIEKLFQSKNQDILKLTELMYNFFQHQFNKVINENDRLYTV